jgi:hypothetical protein
MKKYIYLVILGLGTLGSLGAIGAANFASQIVQEQRQIGKNKVENCYTTTDDKGITTTECIVAKTPKKEKPTQIKECFIATYKDGTVVTECVGE